MVIKLIFIVFIFIYVYKIKFLPSSLTSSVVIFCSFYSFFGLLFYGFGYFVPFELGSYLSRDLIALPIYMFFFCAIFFDIGSFVFYKKIKLSNVNLFGGFIDDNYVLKRKKNIFSIIPVINIAVLLFSTGISPLITRYGYILDDADVSYRKVADVFVWLSIVSFPMIKNRFLSFILFLCLFVLFAGVGSRFSILILFSYILLDWVINNRAKLLLILKVLFSLYVSVCILDVRNGSQQGLIPLLDKILAFDVDFNSLLFLLNYFTTYTILLVSEYINYHTIDYDLFLSSISPLPGFLLDTDSIDSWSRFRKNIPHSAISQLYGHGSIFLVLFLFFFNGLISGYIKNRISLTFKGSGVANILNVLTDILIFIPVARGMQYNVRTSSRLEYMVFFIFVLFSLFMYFLRKKGISGAYENSIYNNKF